MPLETEVLLQDKNKRKDGPAQAEDLALKSAAAYFGDELIHWLGIRERALRSAPTEMVELEYLSQNPKETLTREDIIPLLFSPLMGGRSKQKERILQCMEILKRVETTFSKKEIRKMEAILYIFAVKFLNDNELESIKEAVAMTKLGQMIWNDALEKGREEGEKIGMKRGEQIGLERGAERYSRLILILSKENRNDLIIKMASDPEYREELYKQYGI